MRRFPSWLVPSLALVAACGKPADKAAEAPAADAAAVAPAPAGPQAIVTVLYNPPKDPAAFEKYYVNLTMIESRPAKVAAWEYVFYIDVQGHLRDPQVAKAVSLLREHALFVTILGSYPAAE